MIRYDTLFRNRLFAAVAGLLLFFSAAVVSAAGDPVDQLDDGGRVLMIHHAYVPGTGDPADFTNGDCATQRNLNDQGRAQARDIGAWLRERGISTARVYSSQWCRCLETADLIGLGPVVERPALNSFFERPQDREANLTALRTFLAEQPADGGLIVLVTHFVTISAIAGEGVSSGKGVVPRIDGEGGFEVLGRMEFGS